jgi:type I restriction enzyme S subunit
MIDYHVSVTEKSIESYKVVQVGDFIISLRSFQGGIEYSQYHGICSPAYVILRRRTGGSDAYFKRYLKTDRFIRVLTRNLEGLRDGKMISYKQFSELLLPVPSPAEQQKIAECLSSLDGLIAAEGRTLEALKAHKKGLMQQLFPQPGQTQPRLRFPEFRDKGEWTEATVGAKCKSFSGGTPDTGRKDYYGGEIPFIRSAEIGREKTELFLSAAGLENSAAKMVRKGDILVALYGANSGDVALAQVDGAVNQAILCLRHSGSAAFLFHYLTERKEWVVRTYLQGGQGNLSGEIVKSITIAWPQEQEQHRIADCFTALDTRINAQAGKIESLKQHKRGLMQQLFPAPEDQ